MLILSVAFCRVIDNQTTPVTLHNEDTSIFYCFADTVSAFFRRSQKTVTLSKQSSLMHRLFALRGERHNNFQNLFYILSPSVYLKQCVTGVVKSFQGAGAFHRFESKSGSDICCLIFACPHETKLP